MSEKGFRLPWRGALALTALLLLGGTFRYFNLPRDQANRELRQGWNQFLNHMKDPVLHLPELVDRVHADENSEVAPYEFATLEGDVHVYKMVHHGCEVFIARGHALSYERSDTVSIALGSGCGK